MLEVGYMGKWQMDFRGQPETIGVGADGNRTRYPSGIYDGICKKWSLYGNLGGTAEIVSLSLGGQRLFYFYDLGVPHSSIPQFLRERKEKK